jgi:hypothetical protein
MINKQQMKSRLSIDWLIREFRAAAKYRNERLADGSRDNWAIHCAEWAFEHLAARVKYGMWARALRKPNNSAEFSVRAHVAYRRDPKVKLRIEHVAPRRALTIMAIECVTKNESNKPLLRLIATHYRVVILLPEEQRRLDLQNRSRIDRHRLRKAGIKVVVSQSRKRGVKNEIA